MRASVLAAILLAKTAFAGDGRAWDLSGLPQQLRVGDRVELTLAGPLRAGETLILPEQTDLKNGFLLEALQDGKAGVAVTIVHPGVLTIPALQISGASDGNPTATEPVTLEASSVISNEDRAPQQPEPPMGVLEVPLSGFWRTVFALFSLLAIGLIVWGVRQYLAWRKRIHSEEKKPAPPQLTPEEWAVRELNRIAVEESWTTGNFKKHYFGVSDVLKEFIARQFAFDARESLTEEILHELERQGRPAESLDQLESLFMLLDRVKFTDFKPDWSEPPRVIEDALAWIRRARL